MELKMDAKKWKSILVPREVYEEIKALSKKEGRTIGGQLRIIFEHYTNELQTNHAENDYPIRKSLRSSDYDH